MRTRYGFDGPFLPCFIMVALSDTSPALTQSCHPIAEPFQVSDPSPPERREVGPKLTDRCSDRRDRANGHFRKKLGGLAAANGLALSLARDALFALPFFRMDLESTVIAVNGIDASEREAGELVQVSSASCVEIGGCAVRGPPPV
jgi:hypothetical protein